MATRPGQLPRSQFTYVVYAGQGIDPSAKMALSLAGLNARLDAELGALKERVKELEDKVHELEGAEEGRSEGGGSARPPVEFIPVVDDNEVDSGETQDVTGVTDPSAKTKLLLPGISSSDKDRLGVTADGYSLDMKKVIALVKAAAQYRKDNAGKLPARLAGVYISSDAQEILRLSMNEETVLSTSFQWYEALIAFVDTQGNALKDNLKAVEPYVYDPEGAFTSAQAKLRVKKVVKAVETAYLTAKESSRASVTARGDVTTSLLDKLPKGLAQAVKAVLGIAGAAVPAHISFKDVQDAVAAQFDEMVSRIGKDGSAGDFIVKAAAPKKAAGAETPKDAKAAPKPERKEPQKWSAVVEGGTEDVTGPEAGGGASTRWIARGVRGGSRGRGSSRGGRGGRGGYASSHDRSTGSNSCYNCGGEGHVFAECSKPCKWFASGGECKKGDRCPLKH